MFQRLRDSGLNLLVLFVSLLVFLASFGALSYFAASQRPPQFAVLAAARDLSMGQAITPGDLVEKTVYRDENAGLYIPAEEKASVVGGVAALPFGAGQPLFRSAVLAPAGEGERLAAVLADYPGHSLFPLQLSAQNVIAPDARSFLPGDLVGITVVIASRPLPPATPGLPAILAFPALTPEQPSMPTLPSPTPTPDAQPKMQALQRSFPPLAKDLFPQGVRVIAVQGLPVETVQDTSDGSSFTSFAAAPAVVDLTRERILILLLPDEAREALALAMEQGDRLIVSLLSEGEPGVSPGFTYWDFEERFRTDREQALSAAAPPAASPTQTPSPIGKATPTPASPTGRP